MATGRISGSAEGVAVSLTTAYHEHLRSDPAVAVASYSALRREHDRHRLYIRDRMLCNVIRPRFLSATTAEHLSQVSTQLSAVFERAGAQILGNDALLSMLGASDIERELWRIDPGYEGFTLTSRLDSFLDDGEPHFVEYNAESPASIGFCDCLTEVFLSLPAVETWAGSQAWVRFDAREKLLETLLWAYHQRGGVGNPTIAIIDWDTVVTRRDFELCAEFFQDRGVPTVITDPRRLTYSAGTLRHGDQEIDLVYRRVLLHELLDRSGEVEPLLQAYADGAVCMVNSPRSKLLHKKSLLAMLSDCSSGLTLNEEDRQLVDRTIPWTRIVRPGTTTYRGEEHDLASLMLDIKDRLAIKPSDDYGGKGVVLGWQVDDDAWEQAIELALRGEFVVQERVAVPSEPFPVVESDRVEIVELLVDSDPLLFRGQMGGILTRISGDALLNVTAGTGSTTPTFVVQEGDT